LETAAQARRALNTAFFRHNAIGSAAREVFLSGSFAGAAAVPSPWVA